MMRVSNAMVEQIVRAGGASCNQKTFALLAADLRDARAENARLQARIAELEGRSGYCVECERLARKVKELESQLAGAREDRERHKLKLEICVVEPTHMFICDADRFISEWMIKEIEAEFAVAYGPDEEKAWPDNTVSIRCVAQYFADTPGYWEISEIEVVPENELESAIAARKKEA